MTANIKRSLTGLLAVVLLWAVVALSGGDGTSTDAALPNDAVAGQTDDAATPIDDTSLAADESTPDADRSTGEQTADEKTADEQTADPASARFSDLPIVAPAELPIEAIDTLELIASGGPYPYSKDDSVFQNREGILPDLPRGHYREYTVDTPGESDRGARRIVAGADGELYYTDDHYDSFREIVLGT